MVNNRQMTLKQFPVTYIETIQLWQSQDFEPGLSDYYLLLQENPALDVILNAGPSLTLIMDMRTSDYLYVSKNCIQVLGYEAEEIREKGMNFALSLIHPDDIKEYMNSTRIVWEFLLALPPAQRKNYKTSADFRVKTKTGSHRRVLQQNTTLQTDKLGNIVLLLIVLTDISHLKKETGMTAAIISTESGGYLVWDAADTQLKSQVAFGRREREIIKLLAEGFSSRQIAARLNLSKHTINTHRRNMLEKTNLSNARALVKFAISHGMI